MYKNLYIGVLPVRRVDRYSNRAQEFVIDRTSDDTDMERAGFGGNPFELCTMHRPALAPDEHDVSRSPNEGRLTALVPVS
jgi:hypothetical protein